MHRAMLPALFAQRPARIAHGSLGRPSKSLPPCWEVFGKEQMGMLPDSDADRHAAETLLHRYDWEMQLLG